VRGDTHAEEMPQQKLALAIVVDRKHRRRFRSLRAVKPVVHGCRRFLHRVIKVRIAIAIAIRR
jgi:hypothetical protein